MQILTLVWGALAFVAMVVGLLPCLRVLNWFTVPFAAIGILVSIGALASLRRRDPAPIAALLCNIIAGVIGFLRLRGGSGF